MKPAAEISASVKTSEMAHWLAILRCPKTRQPLRPATREECARLGASRGLVTADGAWFYPMIDNIPSLRPEDAREVTKAH